MRHALIVGLAGLGLSMEEAAFLRRVRPCGIILFARNAGQPEQVRGLIDAVREEIGSAEFLVLIDQEGGRVQRLKPPHWRLLPAAGMLGEFYHGNPSTALTATYAIARLTAQDLSSLGINTNCVPCVDIPVGGAHDIIGSRAYGSEVEQVVALARAVADGHLGGGVLPVLKHIPGHGRATADSHLELPVVTSTKAQLSKTDFATFHALRDLPAAMTAHVVYTAIDSTNPASTSRPVLDKIVRGEIGYNGLLMSDDLSMEALRGTIGERGKAVLEAGCDVALHCNGNLEEMENVAAVTPVLGGAALERFARCISYISGHGDRVLPLNANINVENIITDGEYWLKQLSQYSAEKPQAY